MPRRQSKLNFDFIRDIAPVAGIASQPLIMDLNPSVPVKTVPEFIAYAKANPGKINMASGGNGNPTHVAGELFKMMTGVNMLHVPYRGGGTMNLPKSAGEPADHDTFPQTISTSRRGRCRAAGCLSDSAGRFRFASPVFSYQSSTSGLVSCGR
jgi:tripartite-type tricarboxylate transporter receptor subunit TctC